MWGIKSETPKALVPQFDSPSADVNMDDHRYKGYLYNLREPRYPLTGPAAFRSETKAFPLKSSLVKGLPVMPPSIPKGFVHGSENIGNYTEQQRKEKLFTIKNLEKTSADFRRLQRQKEEREKYMEQYELRKSQEYKKLRLEKEEDLRQLREYNPFGRPGFGAPRGADKKDMSITNTIRAKDGVGIVHVDAKHFDTGARHPPNHPKVQRYEDDRMRRYKVSKASANKYKRELDALVDVRQHQEKLIQEIEKKREDDMITYNPFGKPGGGAPNRDERGNIRMSRKHNFASPEKFIADERDDMNNPWLKLGQPPKREGYRFPRAGDHGIHEFEDISNNDEIFLRRQIGGGGEPLVNDRGEKMTKRVGLLTTIHGARRTENITKVATPEEVRRLEGYRNSPWGKPGAGAPLTNSEGEIVKNTKGRIKHESLGFSKKEEETIERAKKIYRHELMDGIDRQKHIRDMEKEYLRLPPGDVPSWFSKGKVGRPKRDPVTGIIVPQKRIMSDVTAQKFNADRPRDAEKYYQDLQKMADERYKKRLEQKQRLIQQEIKPFPYAVMAPWAVDA